MQIFASGCNAQRPQQAAGLSSNSANLLLQPPRIAEYKRYVEFLSLCSYIHSKKRWIWQCSEEPYSRSKTAQIPSYEASKYDFTSFGPIMLLSMVNILGRIKREIIGRGLVVQNSNLEESSRRVGLVLIPLVFFCSSSSRLSGWIGICFYKMPGNEQGFLL